jgi:hypothetical protein
MMKQKTLEQYRLAFKQKKLITMPLAGTIVWAILGVMAIFIPAKQMVLPFYIGTGSIFYLALFLSKFTGEKLIAKKGDMNPFDALFLYTVVMSLLCFAMAIPFSLQDYSSVPLTLGVLSGLMWLPISWIIEHKVGTFHALSRTIGVTFAWFAFPEQRFVIIPFVIVVIYLISIYILHGRWKKETGNTIGNHSFN